MSTRQELGAQIEDLLNQVDQTATPANPAKTENNGCTIINDNHGTINIGRAEAAEDHDNETNHALRAMLDEVKSLAATLRDLTERLKTLATCRVFPKAIKRRLQAAQTSLSHQTQQLDARAKSMRRKLFAPNFFALLQVPDLKACPIQSQLNPEYPASLTPSAPAHERAG